ncbi:Methionine aminopeptidase 2 [Astathelohania contejeani]|uniref:Methionine aminopeptidase 2 n=1 Tax=Astathelohania contejeani TaxID=164912 RepID=A0ABQ7HYJ6_9MICR|nr:Methionine aminopeptidase 2 [Thelohania contejeani]
MPSLLINDTNPLPIEFLESSKESSIIQKARRAAEAHRRIRYKLHQILRPGITLQEIVETVRDATRILLKGERMDGLGFPCGVSLNDCAAHYTCNPGDSPIVLGEKDVLKIDYGTHVDGRIMDSAFTVAFDPAYEPLLKASKEATEAGIKYAGIDVRVCDIGREIEEVIKSYEIELNGKIIPILPVDNLNGHSISQYKIHDGISIPCINNGDKEKLKGNTFYAIETFASTGNGHVINGPNCSHYMINEKKSAKVSNPNNKKVLDCILKKVGTLPFSPFYLDDVLGMPTSCLPNVRSLAILKILEPYPPLHDIKGSYVSQFEHTIFIDSKGIKENLTKGDDY